MTGFIEYNSQIHQDFLVCLESYNFEEPKGSRYCGEGELIRFVGWLIPKQNISVNLILTLNEQVIGYFPLNTERPDVASKFNLQQINNKIGFDYSFKMTFGLTIHLLNNYDIYELWNFKEAKCDGGFKIIEFMGPSGVGKSTLLNRLSLELGNKWKINLAYIAVSEQFSKSIEVENVYRLLLERKAKKLIQTEDFRDLPHLLNHYSVRAERDLWMISRNNNENLRFINDEGLMHLYLEEMHDLIIENTIDSSDLYPIIKQRMIFNCLLDINKIIENLQKRSLEVPGAVHDQIGRYGVENTFKQIISYKSNANRLIEDIRNIGGSVVDLILDRPFCSILSDIKQNLKLDNLN